MQNFTADSMVLKSEAKSYSTIVNFGNEGLQTAADLPNIMNITTKQQHRDPLYWAITARLHTRWIGQ